MPKNKKIYTSWKNAVKKHVNRDSHIAPSPTSQSFFFKELCCLILASSHRKLCGYIEFLKFDVTKKKLQNSISSKIQRLPPILTKFRINHYLVLVQLRKKLKLDNSKFARIRQFRANFKKNLNIKKFDRFN